jgi:hypothetical protein
VTRRAQAEYIEAVRARYAAATKEEKGRILDEFCELNPFAVRTLRES